MDIMGDVTEMAINELLDNIFKQVDAEAIEDIDKHREKVLGMIEKIPSKDVLIITKAAGKIKLLVSGRDDLEIKKKPNIIDLQAIIENKLDDLKKV